MGSRGPVINEASTPVMLTPTTLKNLTELFESDHCLKQVQAVENGEEFVAPQPPQEKSKKNPLKDFSYSFLEAVVEQQILHRFQQLELVSNSDLTQKALSNFSKLS